MPEEKDKKKSFLNSRLTIWNILIFIVVLIGLIFVWFFGFQPTYTGTLFFQDYYNQSHDSRYQWTQQK